MRKRNVIKIKNVNEHYELFLNEEFECSCDYVELYDVLNNIKEKLIIDKVEFL